MELTIIALIIMITVGIVGVGSRFVLKKGPDNKIEEAAEKVIKKQYDMILDLHRKVTDEYGKRLEEYIENHIDIDIDLSPDTPDPDHKTKTE